MEAQLTAWMEAPLRQLDAETELMLRFQAGEAECFDRLVARFRAPLHGFVYRLLGDAAHSEEVIQEAFLRVYLHRARYSPQARFSTWLYRIAHHLALNHLRDHRRERRVQSLDALSEESIEGQPARQFADQTASVEQALIAQVESQNRQQRIRAAIEALPERQRTAVILHKYQGFDYAGIAQALQVSESATKSLLFRAYESLRRQLSDLIEAPAQSAQPTTKKAELP